MDRCFSCRLFLYQQLLSVTFQAGQCEIVESNNAFLGANDSEANQINAKLSTSHPSIYPRKTTTKSRYDKPLRKRQHLTTSINSIFIGAY